MVEQGAKATETQQLAQKHEAVRNISHRIR